MVVFLGKPEQYDNKQTSQANPRHINAGLPSGIEKGEKNAEQL